MAYDLLLKNGRIIDGSGMPAYRGDVAVRTEIVDLTACGWWQPGRVHE